MTCAYYQYDSNFNLKIDTPFKFNGTSLVRIDMNPIPLGLYYYKAVCTYNHYI